MTVAIYGAFFRLPRQSADWLAMTRKDCQAVCGPAHNDKEGGDWEAFYFSRMVMEEITGWAAAGIVPLSSVGWASLQIASTISIPWVTRPKAAY